MAEEVNFLTNKQLMRLGLIGLAIVLLFAVSFAGFWYYVGVLGNGGVDVLIAFMPVCLLPYVVVISVYVGFFSAKFANRRWQYPWLWGIGGFVLTILFIVGLPLLFASVFPYQSPAIFAFFAPVLSALSMMLFSSIRRKVVL